MYLLRTTIDIPDDLYREARIQAVRQGTSFRAIMLLALEKELSATHGSKMREDEKAYTVRKDGFPILNKREGVKVTDRQVKRLREQEGV